MGYYQPNSKESATVTTRRESSDVAFPLIIAYAQLGCVAWFFIVTASAEGLEALGGVIPIVLLRFIFVISLVTVPYYFIRYRGDNRTKKIIVGLGFVAGLISWNLNIFFG